MEAVADVGAGRKLWGKAVRKVQLAKAISDKPLEPVLQYGPPPKTPALPKWAIADPNDSIGAANVIGTRAAVFDELLDAKASWAEADKALERRLRRGSAAASEGRLPSGTPPSPSRAPAAKARSRSSPLQDADFEDFRYEFGVSSDTEVSAPPREGTAALRARTHLKAEEERAKNLRMRSGDLAFKSSDHDKRRLRMKILGILQEVQRRFQLHTQQQANKNFREHREAIGRGAKADLGDTTKMALGLAGLDHEGGNESAQAQGAASPRRTAILASLSPTELELLGKDPGFHFRGPLVALLEPTMIPGAKPAQASEDEEPVSAMVASLELLADFFAPLKKDKELTSAEWREKLVARAKPLADTDSCSSKPPSKAMPQLPPAEAARRATERMPSLGRHPPVNAGDMSSPTLAKVREVYQKREEADAQWMQERREGMEQRHSQNAFKAREQQREIQLQVFKSTELHRLRMLEAEDRSLTYQAEREQNLQFAEQSKKETIEKANRKATYLLEKKRERATEQLQDWRDGMEQCAQTLRDQERRRIRQGHQHWQEINKKLTKVAERKHNKMKSMSEQNEHLRSRIQSSNSSQMLEERSRISSERLEAVEARLEAAALRRQQVKRGTCYDFLEQAFGDEAVGFDAKSHSVSVDRRSPSWKRNARSWASLSRSTFSMPSLGATPSPTAHCEEDVGFFLTADIPLRPHSESSQILPR